MTIFLQYILMLIFVCIFIFLIIQFYNIAFRGHAPFIPTGNKAIKLIVENIEMPAGGTIYELGSGHAGFLRAVRKKHPEANLIGIEYSFLPYLIGQIQNSLSYSKIKFIKNNFLKVDLSSADAIYCFLSIKSMEQLEQKFTAECKPGTRIISYHFTLPKHQPEKVLEMENKSKIYFYKL